MKFTGERVIEGETPSRIWLEHVARYEFASDWVRGEKVLDIACGTGYGSRLLHDHGASTVLGVDIDAEAVSYANKRYGCPGLEFAAGDALNFKASADFDVVVSFETLEHLPAPAQFVRSIPSLLVNSGIFIVSTPNRRVTSPGKLIAEKCDNPFHQIEYAKGEFAELLGESFGSVKIYGQRENHKLKVLFIKAIRKVAGMFSTQPYVLIDGEPEVKKISALYEPRYFVAVCSSSRT